jgi:hypothetical protein
VYYSVYFSPLTESRIEENLFVMDLEISLRVPNPDNDDTINVQL